MIDVRNYKGIYLTDTLYKVYVSIIHKKLEEELEKKYIIPDKDRNLKKEVLSWTTYIF